MLGAFAAPQLGLIVSIWLVGCATDTRVGHIIGHSCIQYKCISAMTLICDLLTAVVNACVHGWDQQRMCAGES